MSAIKTMRLRVLGFVLVLLAWGGVLPQVVAQDLTAPTQVVNDYLASLINGDTQQLKALIDGPMKMKNRQLELNPDTYSQFLKDHYQGVQTTVEEVVPYGEKVKARVRFDRGTEQGSSVIEFILVQSDGQWKIVDEEY